MLGAADIVGIVVALVRETQKVCQPPDAARVFQPPCSEVIVPFANIVIQYAGLVGTGDQVD
jgi:hypothetical protein